MTKKTVRAASVILYAVGFFAYIYYFFLELDNSVSMMPTTRLILLGTGSVCTYLASFCLSNAMNSHEAKLVMKSTFRMFFVLYVLLLVTFTLFDNMFGRNVENFFIWGSLPPNYDITQSLNLVPLRTINLYIRNIQNNVITLGDFIVNILGNICAFMPFSLFLPLLFPKINKWWKFLIAVSGIVCFIEAMQFVFQKGSCDIDDFILNVTGAMVLYAILKIKRIRQIIEKATLQ